MQCSVPAGWRNLLLPKDDGTQKHQAKVGKKNEFFHKLSLSLLWNVCWLFVPPQKSWFWFCLLALHFGSKIPSGHSESDKILSGKYTVKEISPNAGIWEGRCLNLEKDRTPGLEWPLQMQTREVIKMLFEDGALALMWGTCTEVYCHVC